MSDEVVIWPAWAALASGARRRHGLVCGGCPGMSGGLPSSVGWREDHSGGVPRLGGDMAIRTPDQRLRVFVSSTLGELAVERRAVSRAIAALRLTPVLFELGARPHPPQQLYRAYLAQSDVFIGLYWQRYGQPAPGMQVSG